MSDLTDRWQKLLDHHGNGINLAPLLSRMADGRRVGAAEYGDERWRERGTDGNLHELADELRDAGNYGIWAIEGLPDGSLGEDAGMEVLAALVHVALADWHVRRALGVLDG